MRDLEVFRLVGDAPCDKALDLIWDQLVPEQRMNPRLDEGAAAAAAGPDAATVRRRRGALPAPAPAPGSGRVGSGRVGLFDQMVCSIGQSIIDLRKVGEADEEAGVVRAGVFSRALL